MNEQRFKYFVVIQNPNKPPFRDSVVYRNRLGGTDPKTGIKFLESCRSVDCVNGFYVVAMGNDDSQDKLTALTFAQKRDNWPILGPFDTREQAIIEERKLRPKTTEEKAALWDAGNKEPEETKVNKRGEL